MAFTWLSFGQTIDLDYDEDAKRLLEKDEVYYFNERPFEGILIYRILSTAEDGELKKIKYVQPHKGGRPQGLTEGYYQNGALESKTLYDFGKVNGQVLKYYEDGHIKEIENYNAGDLIGERVSYYPNGKIKLRENYKLFPEKGFKIKSALNGVYERYYDNGQLERVGIYKKGVLEGRYLMYYPTGQIKRDGYFKNNKRDSVEYNYNQDGSLISQKEWKDGLEVADESLFLVSTVSNKIPYLNEGVLVTYTLYFSPRVYINDFNPIAQPSFKNFKIEELPIEEYKTRRTKHKNDEFNAVDIRTIMLFPQKIGALYIDPFSVEFKVQIPTGRRDFFGDPIMRSVTTIIESEKLEINVKKLPKN